MRSRSKDLLGKGLQPLNRIVIVPKTQHELLLKSASHKSLQRCNSVRHHEPTNREFIIFHQGLETLVPILTKPRFEGLEYLADELFWSIYQSGKYFQQDD